MQGDRIEMLVQYILNSEYRNYYLYELSRFYDGQLNIRNEEDLYIKINETIHKNFERCDVYCLVEKEIFNVMNNRKFHFINKDIYMETKQEVEY